LAALPRFSTAFMTPLYFFWIPRYWAGNFGISSLLS
jgi:hypothetical protein